MILKGSNMEIGEHSSFFQFFNKNTICLKIDIIGLLIGNLRNS